MRSLSLFARRSTQAVTRFDHGWRLLAQLAVGRPRDVVFRTRSGVEIVVPNRAGALVPVFEVFAEDEYRLAWFTTGLADGFGVLDVGAHVGSFALAAARLEGASSVTAFEASPHTFGYLERNVAANGATVRPIHAAVTAEAGTLEIADTGTASGHTGVLHLGEGERRVVVPAVSTADAVAACPQAPALVKIDTEGSEYDIVLRSEPSSWDTVRRVVLEHHPMPGRSVADLETWFAAVGLVVVRRLDLGNGFGILWLSRDDLPASSD